MTTAQFTLSLSEFDSLFEKLKNWGRWGDDDELGTLNFINDKDVAAAVAYVQPSRMESFSRTVMEAWLAGIPVLAIDGSEVVDWHCRRSGGGLVFRDAAGLVAHIRSLRDDPAGAADLAAKGRDYVLREYSWPVVHDRIEADLELLP